MQTDHYMANMGKPGRAERLGLADLERVDEVQSRDLETRATSTTATGGTAGSLPSKDGDEGSAV
jgi:hypothetical protein